MGTGESPDDETHPSTPLLPLRDAAGPRQLGRHVQPCQTKAHDLLKRPPEVPPEFWRTDWMCDALADWHMGQVIRAFRTHPHHGQPIRQGIAGRWFGISQAQLSRVENGPPVVDLGKLIHWARILRIPPHLLWFKLPEHRTSGSFPITPYALSSGAPVEPAWPPALNGRTPG